MPLIKSTYPENVLFPQSKIVCDLHFEAKYILGSEKKKLLVPGAVLSVGCVFNIFLRFLAKIVIAFNPTNDSILAIAADKCLILHDLESHKTIVGMYSDC